VTSNAGQPAGVLKLDAAHRFGGGFALPPTAGVNEIGPIDERQ